MLLVLVAAVLTGVATGRAAGGTAGGAGITIMPPVTSATITTTPVETTTTRTTTATVPDGDWPTFDGNPQRTGIGPADTGITAANLGALQRHTVTIDGTVDSAPIELHDVDAGGAVRDVAFMTTTYGRTLALDAATGSQLWQYTPPSMATFAGSPQITTATPVADPDRNYVYAAAPDGYIRKLRVSDGRPVWATRVTPLPNKEEISGALSIADGELLVTTSGYVAARHPFQGQVLALNLNTGAITHVINTECSTVMRLQSPTRCPVSGGGIAAIAGTVVQPDGQILVTAGTGPFNGTTEWGDSVLQLSPALALQHNWTPSGDPGSTEPALIPGLGLAVQAGGSGVMSLLSLQRLDGTVGRASKRTGGQRQQLAAPGPAAVLSQPAVWDDDARTYVFVADAAGTAAYRVTGGHRLALAWSVSAAGTSPLIAGGLLYVYDQIDGTLDVRDPWTGTLDGELPAATGDANSPIVLDGRIILPEGSGNARRSTGTVDLYELSAS